MSIKQGGRGGVLSPLPLTGPSFLRRGVRGLEPAPSPPEGVNRGDSPKSDTNPLTKAKHLYYICTQARHPTPGLIRKGHRSPMSRTSLHRRRPPRAVRDRPAAGTRLLPTPHSRVDHSLRRGIPLALSRVEACPEPRRRGSQERNGRGLLFSPTHLNTHYKRCPRAERLHPGSDQPMSRPVTGTGYGRFPDKSRHALLQGSRLRISAPVEGHTYVADLVLAGESQQSDERRLKTNAPFKDSTVVTTGLLPTTNAGLGSPLPSLRVVEHFWWTGLPHTEIFSALLHILSEVRGKDSTVVTTGELPTTNAGLGSPLPSLRMVEHFWWTGLPHTENFSGLVHIPSEVRGCRRAVADVNRPQGRTPCIGTGVAVFLRNRPGPFIPSPHRLLRHSRLRSGIYPRKRGRGAPSPVGTTGWSPWGGARLLSPRHPRKEPANAHN